MEWKQVIYYINSPFSFQGRTGEGAIVAGTEGAARSSPIQEQGE